MDSQSGSRNTLHSLLHVNEGQGGKIGGQALEAEAARTSRNGHFHDRNGDAMRISVCNVEEGPIPS